MASVSAETQRYSSKHNSKLLTHNKRRGSAIRRVSVIGIWVEPWENSSMARLRRGASRGPLSSVIITSPCFNQQIYRGMTLNLAILVQRSPWKANG